MKQKTNPRNPGKLDKKIRDAHKAFRALRKRGYSIRLGVAS